MGFYFAGGAALAPTGFDAFGQLRTVSDSFGKQAAAQSGKSSDPGALSALARRQDAVVADGLALEGVGGRIIGQEGAFERPFDEDFAGAGGQRRLQQPFFLFAGAFQLL